MKQKFSKKQILTLILLSLILLSSLVYASVIIKENVIFKTHSNNTQFIMGAEFDLYKVEVNTTHLWMDKTYSSKHYTRYCIYVTSPNDVQFTVNSWFATKDSFGQLTIVTPTSTNISLKFQSPNLITASATGVVSQTWTAGNQTLSMIVNSDTSFIIIISTTVTETSFNHTPENMGIVRTNLGKTIYHFKATYWDGDGYSDLDTMKIALTDGSTFGNVSYKQTTSIWTLESGSSIISISTGTTSVVDVNVLAVTFYITPLTTFLEPPVETITIYMWCNDDSGAIDNWEVRTVRINYPPENYEVTITDMEGCGAWVFSEESYYTFQAKYWDDDGYADLDEMKIALTDGVNWINTSYDQSSGVWSLDSGDSVVNLQDGTATALDENLLQVTFLIYFESKILDALDVDIYMYCNDDSGAEDDWQLMQTDYFNIYNLGGFTEIKSSGTASRLIGGDFFDFEAEAQYEETSWVATNVTYRHLQHVKLLPTLYTWYNVTTPPYPVLYLDYTVYYCVDDTWIEGWKIRLNAQGASAGTYVYWSFFVESYNRGNLVKNETIYLYMHNATLQSVGARIWIDLWFNKENASSTCGARANAYFYPMKDNANEWLRWFTGSEYGVDENKRKQSMLFDTLLDSINETCYTSEITLVKIGSNLTVANPTDSGRYIYAKVYDYDVFDLTFDATAPFEGIPTPVFDETRIPVIYGGGFLGHLFSQFAWVIKRLQDMFGPALLGFWLVFVAFMDTIAGWLGWPGGFTDLINWILSFITFLGNAVSTLITILTYLFEIVTGPLVTFLIHTGTLITHTISSITGMMTYLSLAYNDTVTPLTPAIIPILTLIGIMLPFYELVRMEEQGFEILFQDINTIFNLFSFFISLFIGVVTFFLDIIGRVIESIPVVE